MADTRDLGTAEADAVLIEDGKLARGHTADCSVALHCALQARALILLAGIMAPLGQPPFAVGRGAKAVARVHRVMWMRMWMWWGRRGGVMPLALQGGSSCGSIDNAARHELCPVANTDEHAAFPWP